MPKIGSLLDEQVLERLKTVVLADLDPEAPAKTTTVNDGSEFTYTVIKAATDPNPPKRPRPLTAADAIDIDPRGEAMMDAECVDCETPLLVDPQLPEGADPELPRVPICAKCVKVRVRFAAMDQQRIETVRRNHARIKTNEESKMPKVDFDQFTDAELGALARSTMKQAAAVPVRNARPEVEAERRDAVALQDLGIAAEQERRHEHVLKGFKVGTTHEVPTLDLSDVSSLDESPSCAERSPYNKARFRLEQSTPLDPETTTYGFLADEHERLRGLAKAHNKKGKAKGEPKVETVVLAVNDADEKAVLKRKATALAGIMGVSVKEAKAIILASA